VAVAVAVVVVVGVGVGDSSNSSSSLMADESNFTTIYSYFILHLHGQRTFISLLKN
jgi:hypothetical protein